MFLRLTIPGICFSQTSAGISLTTTQYFFLPVKVHDYEDNNTMFIILNIWLYYIGGFYLFFFLIYQ